MSFEKASDGNIEIDKNIFAYVNRGINYRILKEHNEAKKYYDIVLNNKEYINFSYKLFYCIYRLYSENGINETEYKKYTEQIIIDDLSNSKREVVDYIEKITNKKVVFYEGDVCDKVLLEKIFTENKIDAVIHFAGYKAVGESVVKPLMYYKNNILSTINLLEVMNYFNIDLKKSEDVNQKQKRM